MSGDNTAFASRIREVEGRAGKAIRVPGVGWVALFWMAGLVAFTSAVLYLGQPAPDIAGVRVLGGLARASMSATFWTVAGLVAFGAGWLAPDIRLVGGTAIRCSAAAVLTSAIFLLQQEIYCGIGWTGCVHRLGATLVSFPTALVLSASLALAGRAFARAARHREAEIRDERLGTALVDARLDALAVQLRPHFLFNTLQSVATLMHRDAFSARAMLAGLAVLLERSALAGEEQEVPLEEEMDLLRLYTDIESVRFGDRLHVEVSMAPGTSRARVPHLLLQPLVENAIRHAVATQGEGRIEVRAMQDVRGSSLTLEVRDNGSGIAPGREDGPEGVGLANTRARLRTLYGDAHRFELDSRPGEGLTVRMVIPLRNASNGSRES